MAREIAHDYTFEEQSKLLFKSVERLDEVMRAAEWRISNHPETCEEIPGTSLRVTFTDPFPGIPALRIFFSITSATLCTLHWIECVDEGHVSDEYDDDIPF